MGLCGGKMIALLEFLKSVWAFVLNNWKPIVFAILLFLAYSVGVKTDNAKWEAKWAKRDAEIVKSNLDADNRALAQRDEFNKNISDVAAVYEKYRQEHPVIKIKEVKTYVTTKADSNCVITNGFVRMLNLSANADTKGELSADSTGGLNDAPTEIKLSEVASSVSENYGICNLEFKKIEALQNVVREYQRIQEKK